MNFKAFREAKQRYPDLLLLFRSYGGYQVYGEDAEAATKLLDLAVTSATDPVTGEQTLVAGFPLESLEVFLRELLRAGHRVAICDPANEPRKANLQPALFPDD